MKNYIIFAFAIFSVVLFADNSQADDLTYFNTTLCKDYIKQGSSESDKTEIKINLYTRINPDGLKKKDGLSRTWGIHRRACKSFKRRGWTVCDPFFEASDAGSIEIIQEERKKSTVTKTFLYLCTDDKLWEYV